MRILYIMNVAQHNPLGFYSSSMLASQKLNLEFHVAYNRLDQDEDQIKKDNKEYKQIFHQIDFQRTPFSMSNVRALRQMISLMKSIHFDIIHCNNPVSGVIARIAAHKLKISPIIYTAHGFHFYKKGPLINWILYFPVEAYLSRLTDVLTTINRDDYILSKRLFKQKHGKIIYIPGVGVNTKKFCSNCFASSKAKIRNELHIPFDDIIVLSVGDLNKNKNHEVVIRAISNLEERVHYVIAGTGPLMEYYVDLVNFLGIQERVHLIGFRKDIIDIYWSSDIFILPSKREGLSVALMEAMASGLPIICSDIRGNRDLIVNNENGYLVNNNVAEYVERIKILIDIEKRKKFGEKNKECIQNYSIEKIAELWEEVYKELIND